MPVLTCEFRLGTPALSPILHPAATFRGAFPSPGVHALRSAAPVWRWHAVQVLRRVPGEHLVLSVLPSSGESVCMAPQVSCPLQQMALARLARLRLTLRGGQPVGC
ncbi:Vps10 Domain-Containing Receptor Sorcs1 [Manis pentadactyla]|nr:Vps10 Domain-Containing Receptor Sorcs1 [Manis pentadactyla]